MNFYDTGPHMVGTTLLEFVWLLAPMLMAQGPVTSRKLCLLGAWYLGPLFVIGVYMVTR